MKKNIQKKLIIILGGLLFISTTFNILWWFQDRTYQLGQIGEFQEASSYDVELLQVMDSSLKLCGQYVDKSRETIIELSDGNISKADRLAFELVDMIDTMKKLDVTLDEAYYKREENIKNSKFLGHRRNDNEYSQYFLKND